MCLITKQREPFIAEEDMVCYKILYEDYVSPYQNFKYELDKLYKFEMTNTNNLMCFDDEDMHYCDDLYPSWRTMPNRYNLVAIETGCHVALNRKRFTERDDYICKCIIPKGSKYYIGFTDLAVSNQIIIKGRV